MLSEAYAPVLFEEMEPRSISALSIAIIAIDRERRGEIVQERLVLIKIFS